jgi:hypothetical protein
VLNEGQAIAVAKNVRVRQNEMSTPARPIISVGSVGPHSVNHRLRVDAELKSTTGDSQPGYRDT